MAGTFYICLAVLAVLIALGITIYYRRSQESFSTEFNDSKPSLEFLEYLDMGDHRTMVYLQRGTSGHTVLLLHNSPTNLVLWSPLYHTMQRISMAGTKTPNLVAYDIRGHGTAWMPVDKKYNDNDVGNYAWPLDLFVKDCKRVYDRIIGGGKIIVCGFGFGGMVAQKFALDYPEAIEKLVLLQTTIRPMPGLNAEIQSLAGPSGWIAKHPNVTYLTNDEKLVQDTVCSWFYMPLDRQCPDYTQELIDDEDARNDDIFPQVNLIENLLRTGSSTTTLQIDKLLVTRDLTEDWINAKDIPFGIHILAATDDPLAPPTMMAGTYATIYNNNRQMMAVFDIVDGRHAFSVMRPDYIAGIICQDCTRVNPASTYLNLPDNYGY